MLGEIVSLEVVHYLLVGVGALVGAHMVCAMILASRREEHRHLPLYQPPVSVIIPCKGTNEDFEDFLVSINHQDYPSAEYLFCFSDEADPGVQVVHDTVVIENHKVLISPTFESTTDKNQNHIYAIESSSPDSKVLVFLDSDGAFRPDYITSLVQPLVDRRQICTSTFRIYEAASVGGLIVRYWNFLSLYFRKSRGGSFAWSGGMAMRREDLSTLGIPELWFNTLSDDMTLSRKIADLGKEVYLVENYAISTADHTVLGAMSWVRRQNVCAFLCCPRLRNINRIAEIIGASYLAIFIATGSPLYLLPLAGFVVSVMYLAAVHGSWREQLPAPGVALLVAVMSLWISATIPFIRKVKWADMEYEVDNEGRILSRRRTIET